MHTQRKDNHTYAQFIPIKTIFIGEYSYSKNRHSTQRQNTCKYKKILIVILALVSSGMALWPFIPEMKWQIQERVSLVNEKNYPLVPVAESTISTASLDLKKTNILVIPKISVETPIYEGEEDSTLLKGIWRVPYSSNPEQGSNMVLTGHRFRYTFGPQTFYHLDKLAVGDELYVYWQGKKYTYSVEKNYEVAADFTEIESPTNEDILTLYTCTLLDAQKRIVVQAILKETVEVAEL